MCTRGCKGMISSDVKEKTAANHKENSGERVEGSKIGCGNRRFGLPRRSSFSPLRFLKHLGDKMATALRCVSLRRRPSPKVSSKPFSAPTDSHRTEAIEDCIEFINSSSSSSVQRSNSVSAKSS